MDVLRTVSYRFKIKFGGPDVFRDGQNSTWRKFYDPSIEKLDEFATQLDRSNGRCLSIKSPNDIHLAGQLSALSSLYRGHLDWNNGMDSGSLRGQELRERAYDILRKRLGKWHFDTVISLNQLAHWNINIDRRRKYLDEAIDRIKTHSPDYNELGTMLELVKCCLRNEGHEADDFLKALRTLLQGVANPDRRLISVLSRGEKVEWRLALHYVQIRQKDWDATDQLELEVRVSEMDVYYSEHCPKLWLPENCSTMEDLQNWLGTLDRVEGALIKGVVFETSWNLHYQPCAEFLIGMYLGRGETGRKKAEEWLRPLITEISTFTSRDQDLLPKAREIVSKLVGVRSWETSFIRLKRENALRLLCGYKYKYQLADVYARQQRYAEAQPLLEDVVDAKLHKKNPIRDPSRELLITVYLELGEPKKAKPLQESVVEEITKTFGEGSKELLPALRLLSRIYRMNEQWPKKNEVDLCILRYRE